MADENTLNNAGNENLNLPIDDEIETFNENIAAGSGDGEESEEISAESDEETAAGDGTETGDEETGEESEEEDAPAEETEEGEGGEEAAQIEFSDDDDYETFAEKRDAVLEEFELPAEINSIIARERAEADSMREISRTVEAVGGVETVQRLASALDSLYESNGDRYQPNVEPLVNLLRNDYPTEFPSFASGILGADSLKYEGSSVLGELLTDTYGYKKTIAALEFLKREDYELPPPVSPVPEGIDAAYRDAYSNLPEQKRFELESLAGEIVELEAELKDGDIGDYRTREITEKLAGLRSKLDTENQILGSLQRDFLRDKADQETRARQTAKAVEEFQTKVVTEYIGDVTRMREGFIADLAPRLSYLDENTRASAAADMEARLTNALGFQFDDKMEELLPDPYADNYAAQLKAEGVKFDFQKGREILFDLLKADKKIELLKVQNASDGAIRKAQAEKSNIEREIKLQKKDLLGQMAARYVKSNAAQTKKQIAEKMEKKQITRKVVSGGKSGTKRSDSLSSLDAERRAHNSSVTRAIADGDIEEVQRYYA